MRGQQKQKTTKGLRHDYVIDYQNFRLKFKFNWKAEHCNFAPTWIDFQDVQEMHLKLFCLHVDPLLKRITSFLKYKMDGLGSAPP